MMITKLIHDKCALSRVKHKHVPEQQISKVTHNTLST